MGTLKRFSFGVFLKSFLFYHTFEKFLIYQIDLFKSIQNEKRLKDTFAMFKKYFCFTISLQNKIQFNELIVFSMASKYCLFHSSVESSFAHTMRYKKIRTQRNIWR